MVLVMTYFVIIFCNGSNYGSQKDHYGSVGNVFVKAIVKMEDSEIKLWITKKIIIVQQGMFLWRQ